MHDLNKGLHLGLVGATILSAWAFTHVMFALHYAAHYYVPDGSEDDGLIGGFAFPQCDKPGWGEFCYEAFTIGLRLRDGGREHNVARGARRGAHPERDRLLLQHHHPGADDQYRRPAHLNGNMP